MSNILSLEELRELYDSWNRRYNDPHGQLSVDQLYIIRLCETAIEYHRRWQILEDGHKNLRDITSVLFPELPK